MREIKFRAWNKSGKKMIEDVAVSSYCIEYDQEQYATHDNYIPMQYTGLRDKNDKEIYEGDIVKSKDFIFEVKFRNNKAKFALWELNPPRYVSITNIHDHRSKYEIIGNIYENEELLK